jgi:cytochrome P450
MPRTAPGPRGDLLLGSLRAAREDPMHLFLSAAEKYGDIVRFRFGPRIAHLLVDPAHIKQVMQDNESSYGKNTPGFEKIRRVLGNGLLTSEGAFWRRQRRIMQPAFHHKRLHGFAEVMVRCTSELATAWAREAAAEKSNTSAPLDVLHEMMTLTLRIVSLTLLSKDTADSADQIGAAMTNILVTANDRMTRIFDLPPSVPTRENRRFNRDLKVLDDVVLGMIAERRRTGEHQQDLLSMLMEARDEETGEGMDDQQLRDEVMTAFLAGHETTANALTWTLMLLSKHPAEERALREELAAELGGRTPGFADVPKLKRTRAVVDEAMRLYPPAWIIARSCEKDDLVGEVKLAKGTIVFVSPYVTQRSRARWQNPEGFDPQRFLEGRGEALPRFTFFPFGGGPRICIGNAFAITEAVLVLATLLQKVKLELEPGHDCTPQPSITLRPKHGMPMRARAV